MTYVDGFIVAVPKANIEAYKAMAKAAGDVWMEDGALSYNECLADDVPYGEVTSFPRSVQAKDDETVSFFLDRLQVSSRPRHDRRQGDGRSAAAGRRLEGSLRRQAHDLWRLPDLSGDVGLEM